MRNAIRVLTGSWPNQQISKVGDRVLAPLHSSTPQHGMYTNFLECTIRAVDMNKGTATVQFDNWAGTATYGHMSLLPTKRSAAALAPSWHVAYGLDHPDVPFFVNSIGETQWELPTGFCMPSKVAGASLVSASQKLLAVGQEQLSRPEQC